jgi:hypothetical protein
VIKSFDLWDLPCKFDEVKKPATSIFAFFAFLVCLGQDVKSTSELSTLSDSYKRKYFDGASNTIDTLSGVRTFEESGYIHLQNLPNTSPVSKMMEYIKYQISLMDSSDLSRGHTFYVYPIKYSDSVFFRNKYYVKEGQILKIENVISIPHLNIKSLIYYSDGQPFKIFWAFTKNPYLMFFVFYYFDGKNISDYVVENLKTFSPFEYQRAVDLIKDFKRPIIQ